jgi:hypothetical protein
MTEVYNSFTHGPIPLSFTGRLLLQNLRFAIMGAIGRGDYNDPRNEVAYARGELAKYMSGLEAKLSPPPVPKLPDYHQYELFLAEHTAIYRRLNELEAEVRLLRPQQPKRKLATRKPRSKK